MRPIDADAMIDRLKEWDTKDKTDKALYNFTLNRINEQPTIQPEPHWIPCSERMPDRYGKTLVTCGSGVWALVMIAVYSNLMGISKPCFWIGNVGKNDFENITDQVTAWMPLPESYRG